MQRTAARGQLARPVCFGVFAATMVPGVIFAPSVAVKIVFAVLFVLMAFCAYVFAVRRVWVDESGVTAKNVFGETHIAWPDIDHYTFWSLDQQTGAGGMQSRVFGSALGSLIVGLINSGRKADAPVLNRRFALGYLKIVAQDGRSVAIDARYQHAGPVVELAFGALHGQLRARSSRDYSPFALSDQALVHSGKGTIALAEIDNIELNFARIFVNKRNDNVAWVRVAMHEVRNSLLLLEDLAERGVSVAPTNGMYMPPSVLQTLLARTPHQAALPQARVVER